MLSASSTHLLSALLFFHKCINPHEVSKVWFHWLHEVCFWWTFWVDFIYNWHGWLMYKKYKIALSSAVALALLLNPPLRSVHHNREYCWIDHSSCCLAWNVSDFPASQICIKFFNFFSKFSQLFASNFSLASSMTLFDRLLWCPFRPLFYS